MAKQFNLDNNIYQIIDLVNASIYWKDINGYYLGCNQFVLKMAGLSRREDIIGKTDYDLVWKDLAPEFKKIDDLVLKTGRYEGEERIIFVNESMERVFKSVKNQLVDSHGNVVGIIGTSIEFTAEKEAERLRVEIEKNKAVEQEQRRYKDFMDQLKKHMTGLEHLLNRFKIDDLNIQQGSHSSQTEYAKNTYIKLSKREKEVLYCLSLSKSPKEISVILSAKDNKSVTPATIQAIINKQLYLKFDVGSISQLVQKATLLKLIPFTLENAN